VKPADVVDVTMKPVSELANGLVSLEQAVKTLSSVISTRTDEYAAPFN
jgi:hypothetical protein